MGKGDKKSRRGKIINKTYGVRRPRKKAAEVFVEVKPKAKKASPTKKETTAKKAAPAKKKAVSTKKKTTTEEKADA